MTFLELYNNVKDMDSTDSIKIVIKKAVLEELAGEDFSVREIRKKSRLEIIKNETYKKIKEIETIEKRKLTNEEKEKIKKQVEKDTK